MAQAPTKNPLKDKMNDDELDLSISNYSDKDVPVKDIALLKRATKLDLSNNKLTGLPKSFATLTHLVKLDLSCNQIAELPSSFGELRRLKHLDLYNNKLSHLPLSFDQLTALRWLDLKSNQLSAQLAQAAGECLNPRECEQCARRVVQFMGRVREHYDQERLRRQQHEKELRDAKLAAEEAERERLRLEKKAKKEQKKLEARERRRIENLNHAHIELQPSPSAQPVAKQISPRKHVKSGEWTFLGKLNLMLLLTLLSLAVGAIYMHMGGGGGGSSSGAGASSSGLLAAADGLSALAALAGRAAAGALQLGVLAFKQVSQLGTGAGDVLVHQAISLWEWSGQRAGDADAYLSQYHGDTWRGLKSSVGGAWSAAGEYAAHGGAAAADAAGPWWHAACEQGTAVKAGALETVARLRHDTVPVLLQWADGARDAAASSWAALQRETPEYAAAVWDAAAALCARVTTDAPFYVGMVGEQFNRLVAAVTGG